MAPVVVGCLLMIVMTGLLTLHSPMPGPLAEPHGQITSLSLFWGCESCHAEQGMDAGCLSCHVEIAGQLESASGYHHFVTEGAGRRGDDASCASCHSDHNGEGFALVSVVSWGGEPERFDHPHVEYGLVGKHAEQKCEACHRRDEPAFYVPAYPDLGRAVTYLGLRQECAGCHDDVHDGSLKGGCETCHGQESFRPAERFDHDEHLALAGAHEAVKCHQCHDVPPEELWSQEGAPVALPFGKVKGSTCGGCHENPHRTAWPIAADAVAQGETEACEQCHPADAPRWQDARERMTPESHQVTGFRLAPPHEKVECKGCHDPAQPFELRYRDPKQPGYLRHEETCAGCHEDIHDGQFQPKHPLTSLSSDLAFTLPADVTACLDCHERERFLPAAYGLADHEPYWPLVGAHAATSCRTCHEVGEGSEVRQFVGTPTRCSDCHQSPHRAAGFERECERCHQPAHAGWAAGADGVTAEIHATTGFELTAPHEKVACAGCHDPEAAFAEAYPDPAAEGYVRWQDTCQGCHEDIHRGQFGARHPSRVAGRAEAAREARVRRRSLRGMLLPRRRAAGSRGLADVAEPGTGTRTGTSAPKGSNVFSALTSCVDCHERERFAPPAYGVEEHGKVFALQGAHAKTECRTCHAVDPELGARRFADTMRACKQCHEDPHGGQFAEDLAKGDCDRCHLSDSTTFEIARFDHTLKTRWPLTGAHAGAVCEDCHLPDRAGRRVRVYRDTRTDCGGCHRDVHLGQFGKDRERCERCHESTTAWAADRFDHDRDSSFELDGSHQDVACAKCHPTVRTSRGTEVVQYKPIGTDCEDCHGFGFRR